MRRSPSPHPSICSVNFRVRGWRVYASLREVGPEIGPLPELENAVLFIINPVTGKHKTRNPITSASRWRVSGQGGNSLKVPFGGVALGDAPRGWIDGDAGV